MILDKIKKVLGFNKLSDLEKELIYFALVVNKSIGSYILNRSVSSSDKEEESARIVFDNNILGITNIVFDIIKDEVPNIEKMVKEEFEETEIAQEWSIQIEELQDEIDNVLREEKHKEQSNDRFYI